MRVLPLAPLAAAVAASYLLGLSRIAAAALLGMACALALLLAGRRLTLRFAALLFGAALAFAFTAMMLAELIGVPVLALLEGPFGEQAIALVLAWLAVFFAALGLASGLWAMLRGLPDPEDEPPTDSG